MKRTMICLAVIAAMATASCSHAPGAMENTGNTPHTYRNAHKTGTMSDAVLDEISGIWLSRKDRRVLWMVNDSGNTPALYAVHPDGRLLGEFPVHGIDNIDWEDLSGFSHGGIDYLVIADVGDNRAWRSQCSLLFVQEPSVDASGGRQVECRWQMRFQYENGPRDCEAVAVDSANQRILLLSKREKYPVLYELPLHLPPKETLYTAKPVARLTTIPGPTPEDLNHKYGKYRSRPTSMDISSDGLTLVILTYKQAYRYRRKPDQTWQDAFLSPGETIRLPLPETGELVQREALCMDPETGALTVTTEQIPAPIYSLPPGP